VRDRPTDRIEAARLDGRFASPRGARYGAFSVLGPCGRKLLVIADDGVAQESTTGWEHVSVSIPGKHPPNWQEMNWIKEQFWRDDETVLQFHPAKSDYVNIHPNCLHLWRVVAFDHPLPERLLV
jgi:hypothetical protein